MISIRIKLLNGRYHATPWGRNVNEGVPEWPPSPYRLCRAIFDAWKRKFPDVPEEQMERLMTALSGERPAFWLPQATSSHVRAFLHENNARKPLSRQKVFDPFIVVDPNEPVMMTWPDTALGADDLSVLDTMLSSINYLGRSESWCEISLTDEPTQINCVPGASSCDTGMVRIRVAGLNPPGSYRIIDHGKRKISWLSSLALSSKDLADLGLDAPPALAFHDYLLDAEYVRARPRSAAVPSPERYRMITYHLESKVRVPVTETVKLAERARRKLMGIHKRIASDPERVSMRFSGKDADGVPLKGHAHSYICPLDVDRDGFIDHLSVRCKEAYETDEVLALDRLDRLPWVGGHDLLLTPIRTAMDWGEDGCWTMVSRTPYVCGRHYRRGRGDFMEWMRAELVRDLKDAGLPEPHSIQHVPSLSGARGDIQWFQFIRSRKNEQANFGYGFRLVFDRPVPPLYNIGYGAHFGLGLFVQDDP